MPIFLLEVTVGQHLQRGGIEVWNLVPIFKGGPPSCAARNCAGVGIANVVIAFMCIWYYCVIVAWALFYILSSFTAVFPWETCGNEQVAPGSGPVVTPSLCLRWNTPTCVTIKWDVNRTKLLTHDRNLTVHNLTTQTSVEQFWECVRVDGVRT